MAADARQHGLRHPGRPRWRQVAAIACPGTSLADIRQTTCAQHVQWRASRARPESAHPGDERSGVTAKTEAAMSSLVHLGRAAINRAELEAPKEMEALRGTLIPAEKLQRRAR